MKIYIQSAGTSPDFDYCWQPEVPPLLNRVSGLIQNESSSLVLAKFANQFFLLITGLESSQKDFAGRTIRHSIAWITEANDANEKLVRAIACQALQERENLISKVDQLIQLDRKRGFTFEPSQFEDLGTSILDSCKLNNSHNVLSDIAKIGKNSPDLRNGLALELQDYRLPNNYELLVIVTGIKSEDSLTQARIWRSLSDLVKSETWQTISNKKKEDSSPKKLMLVIALIFLLLVIAIIILWTLRR